MNQESCIAILAPGLLGGSLALAIQETLPKVTLHVWARRAEALDEVRARVPRAICTTDIATAVGGATLAILCMPVPHMRAAAQQIASVPVSSQLIVTDVGSVKGSVMTGVAPLLAEQGISFIGSHPMAGSHATGMAAARADLFEKAACLLTPEENTPATALGRLRAFWTALGCRVLEMSPAEHDRAVARISHLPHAMAVLTTLAALAPDPAVLACSAGGFRDTTRVAAGDPAMWTGILRDNRTEVTAALRDAASGLSRLLEMLDQPDDTALLQFLTRAKSLRDLLPPPGTSAPEIRPNSIE